MKLVYKATGKEVQVGDVVNLSGGVKVEVIFFAPPHKASSSGKVNVKWVGPVNKSQGFYVSVIGAEWIEREDRPPTANTYIAFTSAYRGDPPSIEEFKGTWHELLCWLIGINEDDPKDAWPEFEGMNDEELKAQFEDMNGDGCSYVLVWCVEERKQVIK